MIPVIYGSAHFLKFKIMNSIFLGCSENLNSLGGGGGVRRFCGYFLVSSQSRTGFRVHICAF